MTRPTSLLRAMLLGLASATPLCASAQAAEPWQFQATIYGYFPDIGGHTTFPSGSGGSHVQLDIGTILDKLQMAFMGSLEARKGRWGMFTDVIYMNLGEAKSGSRDLVIGPGLPAGVTANLDYDLKGWVWTLAGTYRQVATPRYTLDLLTGARQLSVNQKLGWTLTGNVASVPVADQAGKREVKLENWDAIVGVKGRAALGADGKWFLPYYLDVGAGESKFTWQAMAGVGYSFGWGDVVGAWRYTDYEMKSGDAVESMNFNGPAIAAVFRW